VPRLWRLRTSRQRRENACTPRPPLDILTHERPDAADIDFHEREFNRLVAKLEDAGASSKLSEHATAKPALNDLLVRLRLNGPGA
jgi:hypothetical protein